MLDFLSSLIVGTTIHDANGKPWLVVWPLHDGFYLAVEPDAETPAPVVLVKGAAPLAAEGKEKEDAR